MSIIGGLTNDLIGGQTNLISGGQINSGILNPLAIHNLTSWFRADLGVTLNSSTVSAWADQSGAGLNSSMIQASVPAQPTYNATGINGMPAFSYAGAQGLYGSGTLLGTTASGITIFSITKNIIGAIYGMQYNHYHYFLNSTTTGNSFVDPGNFAATDAPISIGTHILISTWDTSDNTCRIYLDGTNVASTTCVSTGMGIVGTDVNAVGIQSTGAGVLYGSAVGSIAEVGTYNRKLNASELSNLFMYLKNRAGI